MDEEKDLNTFQELLTEARSHLSEEKVAWTVSVLRVWADTRYDVESVATLRAKGGYKDFTDDQLQAFLVAVSIITFCNWGDCGDYTGHDYRVAYEHWKEKP